MDWIDLFQYMDFWRALLNEVFEIPGPISRVTSIWQHDGII